MKDINCPYCDHPQDINHDDGFGYTEDEMHEMQCDECDKYFVFTTSIHFYYEPFKADCLNGSEHKYVAQICYPREFTKMVCEMCDIKRNPTEEELKEIMNR